MTITIVGPKETPNEPNGDFPWFVNTTSRSSTELGKAFSPFFLGPVPLYDGAPAGEALNVENAWQYMHNAIFSYGISKYFESKVLKTHSN